MVVNGFSAEVTPLKLPSILGEWTNKVESWTNTGFSFKLYYAIMASA